MTGLKLILRDSVDRLYWARDVYKTHMAVRTGGSLSWNPAGQIAYDLSVLEENAIASGADDGQRWTGNNFNANGSTVIIGAQSESVYWKSFFNFSNVQIPQGATLTSFQISLYCKANGASNFGQTRAVFLYAVQADDAVSPANYTEYDALAKGANVGGANMLLGMTVNTWWDVIDLFALPPYNVPGLIGAVQDVIDRPGWSIGNNLMILLEGFAGGGASDINYFEAFDSGDVNSAKISFTY